MSRRFNRRPLTDAERDARRQADRERIEQAARALLTSEGWQRWIRVRATNGLSRYSLRNQWLIAIECHARGITPTYVAGFRAFLALNRCVRKGEKAIRILAPVAVKQRDDAGEETGEKRIFFRTVPVFDVSDDRPAARHGARPADPAGAADRGRQPRPPDRPATSTSHGSSATASRSATSPTTARAAGATPSASEIVVAAGPAEPPGPHARARARPRPRPRLRAIRPRAGRGARRLRHLHRLRLRRARRRRRVDPLHRRLGRRRRAGRHPRIRRDDRHDRAAHRSTRSTTPPRRATPRTRRQTA